MPPGSRRMSSAYGRRIRGSRRQIQVSPSCGSRNTSNRHTAAPRWHAHVWWWARSASGDGDTTLATPGDVEVAVREARHHRGEPVRGHGDLDVLVVAGPSPVEQVERPAPGDVPGHVAPRQPFRDHRRVPRIPRVELRSHPPTVRAGAPPRWSLVARATIGVQPQERAERWLASVVGALPGSCRGFSFTAYRGHGFWTPMGSPTDRPSSRAWLNAGGVGGGDRGGRSRPGALRKVARRSRAACG